MDEHGHDMNFANMASFQPKNSWTDPLQKDLTSLYVRWAYKAKTPLLFFYSDILDW